MKHTIFLAFITIILVIPAFASLKQQNEVSVYQQSDSPLQISNVVTKWRTSTSNKSGKWYMLAVEYTSQNVSDKPIRAYTVRLFHGEFKNNNGMTSFSYPVNLGLLSSYQFRNGDIGEGGYQKIPENIKIAVDFVEFADGSIWGEDISKSAEQLAGLRAGAEASLEYLKNINKQNGIEAVINSLDEIKAAPPEKQSSIWKRGFGMGRMVIRIRLKSVYTKQGKEAAEIELQKPFDYASEQKIELHD